MSNSTTKNNLNSMRQYFSVKDSNPNNIFTKLSSYEFYFNLIVNNFQYSVVPDEIIIVDINNKNYLSYNKDINSKFFCKYNYYIY